ncbi:MAG: T9SS type A sorting domain-containing protein [Bacteroidales bacterium]|nr:T9SS type A sorting domain-containing protein [Bacteroidales bacterium]
MKKIATIALLLVLMQNAYSLTSNDSAVFNIPEKYYSILPSVLDLDSAAIYPKSMCITGRCDLNAIGQGYYIPEGIRIKGVALPWAHWHDYVSNVDTLVDYDFDVSVLKYVNRDSVTYLAHAPLNVINTPITDTLFINLSSTTVDTLPIYEALFASPLTVRDSFFCVVGTGYNKEGGIAFDHNLGFDIRYYYISPRHHTSFLDNIGIAYSSYIHHKYYWWNFSYYNFEDFHMYLIFPILDIPESAGVEPTDAIGSNAGLWPNPAQDECTVASGYGLRSVEVYDIGGRLVMKQAASGLATRIDTSQLPRGTYLVKIETPLGSTTKKLVVE